MNKKLILKKGIALCLVLFMGLTVLPVTSYAKAPTIDTQAQELTIGKNQLKMYDYDAGDDTLLGSFIAPESGKYNFNVVNNGNQMWQCVFLNEDLEQIAWSSWTNKNGSAQFTNWSLQKDHIYYFYINSDMSTDLLAAKIEIKRVQDSKPALNKTATSLKENGKVTLKLKNNKKTIVWVSSDKSIATVSSKGVVTAKKKGTAYIYAIVNSKAYKCKVAVY